MNETVQANDGIDEPEFGYYPRMEGYANLSSDMKELYAIQHLTLRKKQHVHVWLLK